MDNEQPYIFFEEQKKVNHVQQNPHINHEYKNF